MTFAGHPVEPLSGERYGKVWYRSSELRAALSCVLPTRADVDALIERTQSAGGVEYGPVDTPEGRFFIAHGVRVEIYPPGRYVVREQLDGYAVLWRLEDPVKG